MSNTVKVRIGKRYEYLPFRWDGDTLLVCYKNEWRAVWREKKINGEYTFTFAHSSMG